MAVLNSNPEILLRKRKNNDRKRLEKQEQAQQRRLDRESKRKHNASNKFIRAETLISNNKSNELENKRISKILKHEKQKNEQISTSKEVEPKLLFIIRVPNHIKGLRIPKKANNVLELLRLTKQNTGVFVKVTPALLPLLKLISPYIVAGTPSLNSVRQLFNKRASITIIDENEANEQDKLKSIKLNNNQLVEDKFGDDLGIICIEDIIHEIATLGENFKALNNWLDPFHLSAPVSGWNAISKLHRIQYAEEHKRKISMAANAQLQEIDIDKFIEEQN